MREPKAGGGETETNYAYNAHGKLASKKDGAGREIRYSYEDGRLMGISYWRGGVEDVGQRIVYQYDVLGRLEKVMAQETVEVYGYTPAGQVAWKRIEHPWEDRQSAGWQPLQVEWSYTSEGRVDVVKYPSGQRVRQKYTERSVS